MNELEINNLWMLWLNQGDEEAKDKLYRIYFKISQKQALGFYRNKKYYIFADDCFSAAGIALIRAFKKFSTLATTGNLHRAFCVYLNTSIRCAIIDEMRKKNSEEGGVEIKNFSLSDKVSGFNDNFTREKDLGVVDWDMEEVDIEDFIKGITAYIIQAVKLKTNAYIYFAIYFTIFLPSLGMISESILLRNNELASILNIPDATLSYYKVALYNIIKAYYNKQIMDRGKIETV